GRRRGVGTLASPSSCSQERLAAPPTGDASVPTPLPTSPAPTNVTICPPKKPPPERLCWRMTVGVQRGGFGPSRATTRDRPYHAPKHCSGPFVHGRGDPLWSPSLGRTLLSTRAVIRQQSHERATPAPTRMSSPSPQI